MVARRLRLGALVWLCALAGLLVFGAAVAFAADMHEFLPAISAKLNEGVPAVGPHGEAIPVSGPFSEIRSMMIDSGELYVGEGQNKSRIDKFEDSTGAFLSQLPQISAPSPEFLHQGLVIGRSTGEAQLYVAGDAYKGKEGPGAIGVLNLAGSLEKEWLGADTPSGSFGCFECNGPIGLAVDSSSSIGDWAAGDVYVPDEEKGVVDVFKPQAGGGEEYITRLEGPEAPEVPFSRPTSVAVNQSNGEAYVVDKELGNSIAHVDIFKPAAVVGQYEFIGKLTGQLPGGAFESVRGVTVDGGTGEIYVYGGTSVEQFNASSEHIARLIGASADKPFGEIESVAVDPESHDLYVADFRGGANNASAVDVFGPNLIIPDVFTEEISSGTPFSATLNGKVNADKEGEASCRFAWGTTKQFGQFVPCEPERTAEGEAPVPVHANLSGLQPDTTYYFLLQATNKHGTNSGEPAQIREFTTLGPGIHSESASDVAGTSATLDATINPHRASTTYYFQYGTDTGYGSDAPASPGAVLGSGEGDVEVRQPIEGLALNTTYHYRVVAVSELEAGHPESFLGPDRTFTTQTAGGRLTLPDDRSWEMVSPPEKQGALIEGNELVVKQASAAGNALTYEARSPSEANPQGYSAKVQILSTRGSDDWSSRDIATPREKAIGTDVGPGEEYRLFSEDLSLAVVQPLGAFIPSSSPFALSPREASEQTAFLRTDYLHGNINESCTGSCFRPLVTGAPGYANVPAGTAFGEEGRCPSGSVECGPEFVGASPDLGHVVLKSAVPLVSGVNGEALYEWDGGKLVLVSVLPESETLASGAYLGAEVKDAGRQAISDDGSRVVWTSNGNHHLYVRDTATSETVQIDVPEPACVAEAKCGSGPLVPYFQAASSDGSRIFFTDTQQLTKGSGASSNGPDLYECQIMEVAGKLRCKLSDLTPLSGGEAADVQGDVLGASRDGSWVYFVANGVLAQGAEPGRNLYVWHDGTTSLVAIVANDDGNDWLSPGRQTARVSSDGRWLTFMSERELTGYDTRDALSGQPDVEVYLYDAAGSGRLMCASCNPSGARPLGMLNGALGEQSLVAPVSWSDPSWIAASVPTWTWYGTNQARYQPRYLSDNGRLFFNSSDALVPQDVNGGEDVYQYEPPGVGDCTSSSVTFSERSGGCVGLISSGASDDESVFVDASESGGDVFFQTTAKLVPQDFDTAYDIYDAHECGTAAPCFAAGVETPPACTTADSCKAAPAPQPTAFGAPASATFSGAGNVVPLTANEVKARTLSRAQKLARAVKACRARKSKRKRRACEAQARKRYGSSAKSHRGGK